MHCKHSGTTRILPNFYWTEPMRWKLSSWSGKSEKECDQVNMIIDWFQWFAVECLVDHEEQTQCGISRVLCCALHSIRIAFVGHGCHEPVHATAGQWANVRTHHCGQCTKPVRPLASVDTVPIPVQLGLTLQNGEWLHPWRIANWVDWWSSAYLGHGSFRSTCKSMWLLSLLFGFSGRTTSNWHSTFAWHK